MSKVFVDDWLSSVAKAEFFICPPGYVMPMCHNAVEAMAVGAIPLINYPEWFRPNLQHLQTCISFDDESDLAQKIDYVLRMKQEDIARMRRNVLQYYDRHLDPTAFVREIEARDKERITVLQITDACVVKSASKLNAKSILIRDAPLAGVSTIRRTLHRLLRGKRAPADATPGR